MVLSILENAARAGGNAALAFYRHSSVVLDKGLADFATDGDLSSGKAIRAILEDSLPQYPILSEERPFDEQAQLVKETSKLIFDEIDGSVLYKHGGTAWGVLVGLVQNNILTHSVTYLPCRDLLISAELGKGSTINGVKIIIPPTESVAGAPICAIVHRAVPLSWHTEVVLPLAFKASAFFSGACSAGCTQAIVERNACAYIHIAGRPWDFLGALAVTEGGAECCATMADGSPLNWETLNMSILLANSASVQSEILCVSKPWCEENKTSGL